MKRLVSLGLLAWLALSAGCTAGTTAIKTLLDDPARFDHKQVRVAGNVTHALGVLNFGGYQVDDGSGTLTVVSKQGGAPREGAKVGVEGEFRSGFTVGTETVAVLLEKQRFTP